MDNKEELMKNTKNSVGSGLAFGTPTTDALKTSSEFVYRVTGMDQILDIIECGYVRPKGYGARIKRVGPTNYWSIGGDNVFYKDKRPVISASIDAVKDGQIGPISITDLSAIWMYNAEKQQYENKLKEILNIHKAYQLDLENIDKQEKHI